MSCNIEQDLSRIHPDLHWLSKALVVDLNAGWRDMDLRHQPKTQTGLTPITSLHSWSEISDLFTYDPKHTVKSQHCKLFFLLNPSFKGIQTFINLFC